MGWKNKAVEILVIEGVVRRRAAGDLGGVVVADEIARIIEIELLFGAVNMDAGWEGNFKHPPTFAVLFVRRDLLATNAILSEQERHGHVVLECVTDEVEELLFCPGRLGLMALKRLARLVELRCLNSRVGLDRDAAVAEYAATARRRKRRDQRPLAAGIDLNEESRRPWGCCLTARAPPRSVRRKSTVFTRRQLSSPPCTSSTFSRRSVIECLVLEVMRQRPAERASDRGASVNDIVYLK